MNFFDARGFLNIRDFHIRKLLAFLTKDLNPFVYGLAGFGVVGMHLVFQDNGRRARVMAVVL